MGSAHGWGSLVNNLTTAVTALGRPSRGRWPGSTTCSCTTWTRCCRRSSCSSTPPLCTLHGRRAISGTSSSWNDFGEVGWGGGFFRGGWKIGGGEGDHL